MSTWQRLSNVETSYNKKILLKEIADVDKTIEHYTKVLLDDVELTYDGENVQAIIQEKALVDPDYNIDDIIEELNAKKEYYSYLIDISPVIGTDNYIIKNYTVENKQNNIIININFIEE